jgi:hypothetical protein
MTWRLLPFHFVDLVGRENDVIILLCGQKHYQTEVVPYAEAYLMLDVLEERWLEGLTSQPGAGQLPL